MRKKIISLTPYFILLVIITYTWINIAFTIVATTPKGLVGLLMIIANGFVYLKRYKLGIILTGAILILATLNGVTFYTTTATGWIKILGLQTPEIQYWSLLILIYYCSINFNLLVDMFLDYQEKKSS